MLVNIRRRTYEKLRDGKPLNLVLMWQGQYQRWIKLDDTTCSTVEEYRRRWGVRHYSPLIDCIAIIRPIGRTTLM